MSNIVQYGKMDFQQFETMSDISKRIRQAYQPLACETTINTEFIELFSLKSINVKYKNAILSHIDCFFRTWKD